MSLTVVEKLTPVLQQVRSELAYFDRHREEHERDRMVRHLALVGHSESQIAVAVGVSDRTVARIKHLGLESERPTLPTSAVTDERAEQLERTAALVSHLAFLLRDEDPNLLWGFLSRLDRGQLQELAVVALAAIPIDATTDELFAWVNALPAAIEDR